MVYHDKMGEIGFSVAVLDLAVKLTGLDRGLGAAGRLAQNYPLLVVGRACAWGKRDG